MGGGGGQEDSNKGAAVQRPRVSESDLCLVGSDLAGLVPITLISRAAALPGKGGKKNSRASRANVSARLVDHPCLSNHRRFMTYRLQRVCWLLELLRSPQPPEATVVNICSQADISSLTCQAPDHIRWVVDSIVRKSPAPWAPVGPGGRGQIRNNILGRAGWSGLPYQGFGLKLQYIGRAAALPA